MAWLTISHAFFVPAFDRQTGKAERLATKQRNRMHYFWFIPLVGLVLVGVWVLYLLVARGQPEHPERSVEGALAEDQEAATTATTSSPKSN
jgi:hypothetical protein